MEKQPLRPDPLRQGSATIKEQSSSRLCKNAQDTVQLGNKI